MNRDFTNTLEALANLIYLARASLANKQVADVYLAMADDMIQAAALRDARPKQ